LREPYILAGFGRKLVKSYNKEREQQAVAPEMTMKSCSEHSVSQSDVPKEPVDCEHAFLRIVKVIVVLVVMLAVSMTIG
jgi:hypothetical protein